MLNWKQVGTIWLPLLISLSLGLNKFAWAQSSSVSSSTSSSSQNLSGIEETSNLKKFDGSWRLRLMGTRLEDPSNQKSTSEFSLFASLNYKPFEMLSFNLSPRFKYTNGYAQTENLTNTNQSEWLVRNASVDLRPSSIFEASVGALDQEKIHHRILLADTAFPAARLALSTPAENIFIAGVNAETAIATSNSLTTQTKEFEKTPTFNSGGVFLKLQKTVVEAELSAQLWQFANLPMSLATTSGLLGNSVTSRNGGIDSEFIYQYKGYEASGKINANLGTKVNVGGWAAWVRNSEAPTNLNQGMWGQAFVDIFFSKNWMITPSYEYFRIEPDAAVAAYNSDTLFTNCVGYRGGLAVEYKKTVRVSMTSGERDAVYFSPFQQREKIWTLKLETLDVAI